MKPIPKFEHLPRPFWAHVKLLSESLGYSDRRSRSLRRYTPEEIAECIKERNIDLDLLKEPISGSEALGTLLHDYLNGRSSLLEEKVEPFLMDRDEARAIFKALRSKLRPKCALPWNKQKKDKRHHAFFVGIVNMLAESTLGESNLTTTPGDCLQ
jgi:hypothetical protein